MGKFIDLTGQRFGCWIVLHKSDKPRYWYCRCECGVEKDVYGYSLTAGKSRICCHKKYSDDYFLNHKFGLWTVLYKSDKDCYWHCRCDCGKEKDVYDSNLIKGKSISCGCSKRIDITGKQYGRLTVLNYAYTRNKHSYWHCYCDCGNEKDIEYSGLKAGTVKSCGCLNKEIVSNMWLKDLTGKRFGRLVVMYRSQNQILLSGKSLVSWHVKCDCGNEKDVNSSSLLHTGTQSCGCLIIEKAKEVVDLTNKRFGKLLVLDYAGNSKWICQCDCGNICVVATGNLNSSNIRSCGCISESKYETWCKSNLKLLNYTYNQHQTFDCLYGYNGGKLSYDFAIYKCDVLKCLIECQGEQHYKPIEWFGGEEQFAKQQLHDELKREYAEKNNIKLVEIPYWYSEQDIKKLFEPNGEIYDVVYS